MYDYKNLDIVNAKAKFYAKELWNMDLDIPLVINTRLRTTHAWQMDDKIELNKHYVKMSEFLLDDLILHELCHWYCEKAGKDSHDFTRDFELELKSIGASSTGTTCVCSNQILYLYDYVHFKCDICGKEMKTKNYLEEKQEGHMGRCRIDFYCCENKMESTKQTKEAEEFIPNDKILNINNKFKIMVS